MWQQSNCELELPWNARCRGLTCAHTVTVLVRSMLLLGATPPCPRVRSQQYQIFWHSEYANTVWDSATKFGLIHLGRDMFLGDQPRPPDKGQNLSVLSCSWTQYLLPHRLTQNHQLSNITHVDSSLFLGDKPPYLTTFWDPLLMPTPFCLQQPNLAW